MHHFIQSSLLYCYVLVCLFSFGAAFLTPAYSHWDAASSTTTCTSTKRTPVSTLPAYYFSYPTPFRSHDQHALFQKKMKFVLYYQNYRDPQDFVVDDQQRSTKHQEHLPTEAASSFTVVVGGDDAASISSTLVSSSHSSSPSVAATTVAHHPGEKSAARSTVSSSFINKSSAAAGAGATNNALTIPAAANVVPWIDLPRTVFEKLILLRESDEDSFPDLEILSGRIAIVLSLYLFSTEILTGEGVLDQVSHLFS